MPLRQLVPPSGSEADNQGRDWKVDIIAVSGLNPWSKPIQEHAKDTWTKPTRADGFLWLRDEIPKMCPHARVFYYEYNSTLVFGQTKEPFTHKANDFLEALRIKRKGDPDRPIFFIAHSLGGVLITQALVNAHNNPEYTPIKDATASLMFFSTPHGGGNGTFTAIGSIAAGIATTLGFREKSDIASTLKSGTIFSDILREHFRQQLLSYRIVSWYEKVGNVVPRVSANFGLPGTHERILGIDADHSDMCRFDPKIQKDRDNLEEVMSSVEDLYRVALEKGQRPDEVNRSEFSNSRKKILKWLYRSEHADDYEADLGRHLEIDNTCHWLSERPEYLSWASHPSSHILWINGIPGSGKSFLAAHAIRHLLATHRNVFYFFCNDRYEDTRLLSNVFGCLIYQMLLLNDNLTPMLASYRDKSTQKRLKSLDTSVQILADCVAALEPCFIVIDALDECAERTALARILRETLPNVSRHVKVIATSRDEADIRTEMGSREKVQELRISDHDIMSDVKIFVEHRVSRSTELSLKLADCLPLKRDVIHGLVAAAQGMFLLPSFMVTDLETKATVDEIYECLDHLPVDLDSYYISTMSRMDARRRQIAKKVFTWVLRTKRPLNLEEMKAAMSLDGSRYLNLESDIKSSCGCLVTMDKDKVRLSHNTVKQFLLESALFRTHVLRPHYLDDNGAEHIADVCANYIFRHRIRIPIVQGARFGLVDVDEIRSTYPFLEYAAMHWVDHCRDSVRPNRFLADINNFLNSPRFPMWYEAASMFNFYEGFAVLFDQLQQWFLSLQLATNRRVHQKADVAVTIASNISRLWKFIETWENAIKAYPNEIYNLEPFLNASWSYRRTAKQSMFQTSKGVKEEKEQQLYNLVDGHFIGWGVDRFLIGATSIFSWNSLMTSEPWDVSISPQVTPEKPEAIKLNVQNVYSRCVEGREGLALAGVDRLTAHAILRPDLGAVAIVWGRYDADMTAPLAVKTYAWHIRPESVSIMLKIIQWTDKDDPCRVDLTSSSTFKGSRAALAFQQAGDRLWTPGGAYELKTGTIKEHPPELFDDPQMSSLTFSRDASTIAGVREGNGLEIYPLPDGPLIASAEGDIEILGLSPFGSHCLYVQRTLEMKYDDKNDHLSSDRWGDYEDVRILSTQNNASQVVWVPCLKVARTAAHQEPLSLHHFYNNGGLFAFSENESILVLCVPTFPLWEIIAFELQEPEIARTRWTVDCADILMGTAPLCLSFCPFNDRRLYILNNLGIIRAAHISRKDTTSSASLLTTRKEKIAPVLSGVYADRLGVHLVVLEMADQTLRGHSWDLETLTQVKSLPFVSIPLIRCLTRLRIDNLTVDIDAIIHIASISTACRWDPQREEIAYLSLQNSLRRNLRIAIRHAQSRKVKGEQLLPESDSESKVGTDNSNRDPSTKQPKRAQENERQDLFLAELQGASALRKARATDAHATENQKTYVDRQQITTEHEAATERQQLSQQGASIWSESHEATKSALNQCNTEVDSQFVKDVPRSGDPPLDIYDGIVELSTQPKVVADSKQSFENADSFNSKSSAMRKTVTQAQVVQDRGDSHIEARTQEPPDLVASMEEEVIRQQDHPLESKSVQEEDTDISSVVSDDDIETVCSATAKLCPTGELTFLASTMETYSPTFREANTRIINLIVSIIRTDKEVRKVTGRIGLVTIGTLTRQCVLIEYDPVYKVLAYSISLMYHQKMEEGSFWRFGNLFWCRLTQPTAITDSEYEEKLLSSTAHDLKFGFTSMIFSPCGRYIYGTSSWTKACVEIVDTWGLQESRYLCVPQNFCTAKNVTISYWRDHIMLVGNHYSVISAARISMAERASFSIATLAVAPSAVENVSGFRVLWPQDDSGEGIIVIVSQNGNQVMKNGEVDGPMEWPFVIKVKEKDISAWSEPMFEPEIDTDDDFPERFPDVTVFT